MRRPSAGAGRGCFVAVKGLAPNKSAGRRAGAAGSVVGRRRTGRAGRAASAVASCKRGRKSTRRSSGTRRSSAARRSADARSADARSADARLSRCRVASSRAAPSSARKAWRTGFRLGRSRNPRTRAPPRCLTLKRSASSKRLFFSPSKSLSILACSPRSLTLSASASAFSLAASAPARRASAASRLAASKAAVDSERKSSAAVVAAFTCLSKDLLDVANSSAKSCRSHDNRCSRCSSSATQSAYRFSTAAGFNGGAKRATKPANAAATPKRPIPKLPSRIPPPPPS
ncbi:hypothetical protein M885DRAFT_525906 [Pelagophyceae sp. CCMP2097]|nr:hypothetical protein M885DRAFT_525906 [Pelagophyceae sp. CCMP2097]